jgi:hypothetical protein
MALALPLYRQLRNAQGGDQMGTTWDSGKSESKNQAAAGKASLASNPALASKPPHKQVSRIGRDARLRWTRAQKYSAIACFVLLGILLAVSACSKQESKPALAGISGSAPTTTSAVQIAAQPVLAMGANEQAVATTAAPKKVRRKLAANVTYSDANSGVSFMYPRKAELASAVKTQSATTGANYLPTNDPRTNDLATNDLPMNFVQSGGTAVATVALPRTQYAGTDFAGAEFRVNVNRSLSAEECPHFAFIDTSDADGEPIDAEKVKVGSTDMNMTSEFAGDATKQLETRYYHAYENGACYEYVLGLSTAGFGLEGVHAVDRDEVFGRLQKILDSVKIQPASEEQVAQEQNLQKENTQKQTPVEAAAVPDCDK